jgi:hypothetical protein
MAIPSATWIPSATTGIGERLAKYEAAVWDCGAGSGASIRGERSQDQAGDIDT